MRRVRTTTPTIYETADVNMLIDGKTVSILKRRKIHVNPNKPDEGVIVKDGRPVKKIDNKWYYFPSEREEAEFLKLSKT